MRLTVTILMLCVLSAAAWAAVPPMINYQGKLMQPSGAPVPDGTYAMQFAIYDEPAGTHAALWSETNPSVQVKGGLFAVMLGSVTNLPANIFDTPERWFGVKVGADPEMIQRQRIASVAYAQVAGNGVPIGGVIMWSGSVANIPAGWALCDGTDGTPNLRDKFIVGAGGGYAAGAQGGVASNSLSHSHTVNDHLHSTPSHSHSYAVRGTDFAWMMAGSNAGNLQAYNYQTGAWVPGVDAAHFTDGVNASLSTTNFQNVTVAWRQSTGATSSSGSGQTGSASPGTNSALGTVDNLPPYYALCFIMKVGS